MTRPSTAERLARDSRGGTPPWAFGLLLAIIGLALARPDLSRDAQAIAAAAGLAPPPAGALLGG